MNKIKGKKANGSTSSALEMSPENLAVAAVRRRQRVLPSW